MSAAAPLTPTVAGGIDPALYRHVLGHYPTGAAVITAEVAGAAVEMVVGSFTSVSLAPALVAFLPAHSSASWARMRAAEAFVVNILGAEDEALCRQMSAKNAADRWTGVAFGRSAGGLRKLDRAVAHVECRVLSITPAGDHDIVLGEVTDLALHRAGAPLVFCQGRFGTFTA